MASIKSAFRANVVNDPKSRKIVEDALEKFGASLSDEGFIQKSPSGPTGIFVTITQKRMNIRSSNGSLLSSGPPESSTVEKFIHDFWSWERVNSCVS